MRRRVELTGVLIAEHVTLQWREAQGGQSKHK